MNTQEVEARLKALPGKIVDNVTMIRLASGATAIIRERTLAGKFLEGSSPGSEQYSVKPLPLPFGKLQASVRAKLDKKQLENKEQYVIFTAKSGNKWIIVKGGYKQFRALAGKFNEHVVMSWTGRMLRNMSILRNSKFDADIGFGDEEMSTLARWHNIEGAGKSRRKHVFFDLTNEERELLAKLAGETVAKNFLKTFAG